MKRIFMIVLMALEFCLIFRMYAQPPDEEGKKIFASKCARCHGADGSKGALGAKNLRVSTLDDERLYVTIAEGKKMMPSWKRKLTPEQIGLVISYIKSLRTDNNQH